MRLLIILSLALLFAQPAFGQRLTCDLSEAIQKIEDRVNFPSSKFPEEVPIAKMRVKTSKPKSCGQFQRALNMDSCRDAVTLVNAVASGDVRRPDNRRQWRKIKRLLCKGRIALIGFKGGKRFRARLNRSGTWTGFPSDENEASSDEDRPYVSAGEDS